MQRLDVVVVGAGLCGLITARELLQKGFSIAVVEATNRMGGMVESIYLNKDLHASAKENNDYTILEFGCEWFDIDAHGFILEEVRRYGLTIVPFQDSERTMWSFCAEKRLSLNELPVVADEIECYNQICSRMNADASRLHANEGFIQLDNINFDMSLADYLDQFEPCDSVREFFISKISSLMRAPMNLMSTMQFLRTVNGFGSVEKYLRGNFCKIKEGFSELIRRIYSDLIRDGCIIKFNFPVQNIIAIKEIIQELKYREDGTQYYQDKEIDSIKVSIDAGDFLVANTVISCIPMKCLSNINIKPELPEYLKYGLAKSNIGDNCNDYSKGFLLARGISNIDNAITSGNILEASTIVRGSAAAKILEVQPDLNDMIRSMTFSDALRTYINKAVSNDIAILKVITSDVLLANKEELLRELRKIHPTITDIGWISTRSYSNDVWLKSAGFSLRKGIGRLYSEMCDVSNCPWKEVETTVLNIGSTNLFAHKKKDSAYQSNEDWKRGMSFVIGGSEFSHTGWVGWLDGAVENAKKISKTVFLRLRPPPPERNLSKKKWEHK